MAGKNSDYSSAEAAPVVETLVETFDLPLDEFCRRLSAQKVGPEMIGGFHHTQTAAKNFKASEAVYAAAFSRFVTQPA
jgi:hypothetical protein